MSHGPPKKKGLQSSSSGSVTSSLGSMSSESGLGSRSKSSSRSSANKLKSSRSGNFPSSRGSLGSRSGGSLGSLDSLGSTRSVDRLNSSRSGRLQSSSSGTIGSSRSGRSMGSGSSLGSSSSGSFSGSRSIDYDDESDDGEDDEDDEREDSEELSEDDILDGEIEKEAPDEMSEEEILSEFRDTYKPKGGPMDVLIKQVSESARTTDNEARSWVNRSKEAIKATHHVIAEASNDAQEELMKDGLRLDEAVRNNLEDETAKMHAITIDPSRYGEIKKEVASRTKLTGRDRAAGSDSRIQYPHSGIAGAGEQEHVSMVGQRVKINGYSGENHWDGNNAHDDLKKFVSNNQYGVIVSKSPDPEGKFRVRLKTAFGKDIMPLLKQEEFTPLDGTTELDGVDLPPERPANMKTNWKKLFKDSPGEKDEDENNTPSEEWVAAMNTWGNMPVLIHHIPPYEEEIVGEADQFINQLGQIIDYRNIGEHPEFRVKLDSEDDAERKSVREKMRPWLVLDRDFAFVKELEGKEIQVNIPEEGNPGTQEFRTSIQDRGLVKKWNAAKGWYDVDVLEHEEPVFPQNIQHLDGLDYVPQAKEEGEEEEFESMRESPEAQFDEGGWHFNEANHKAQRAKVELKKLQKKLKVAIMSNRYDEAKDIKEQIHDQNEIIEAGAEPELENRDKARLMAKDFQKAKRKSQGKSGPRDWEKENKEQEKLDKKNGKSKKKKKKDDDEDEEEED